MVHGIPGEIVATDQPGWVARNAAVIILAGRIARRRRPSRRAGVRPTRNSLNGTKITQCGAQQMVRSDKEVAGAYRQPAADLPINLEAGLF